MIVENLFDINEDCFLSNLSLRTKLLSLLQKRPLTVNEFSHLTGLTSLTLLPYLYDLVNKHEIIRIDDGNTWYKKSRKSLLHSPGKKQTSNQVILKHIGNGIFREQY